MGASRPDQYLADTLKDATPAIQQTMLEHFYKCDEDYGRRIEDGLKAALSAKAKAKYNRDGCSKNPGIDKCRDFMYIR